MSHSAFMFVFLLAAIGSRWNFGVHRSLFIILKIQTLLSWLFKKIAPIVGDIYGYWL